MDKSYDGISLECFFFFFGAVVEEKMIRGYN